MSISYVFISFHIFLYFWAREPGPGLGSRAPKCKKQLKNVIETTSLDNLKKLEQKDTFSESAKDSSGNKINFFDKGGKRNWSKELSQDMKVQLEKALNKEMRELGYL